MITNLSVPGFHSDPSAVRVGDWDVVDTTTFVWFATLDARRSHCSTSSRGVGAVMAEILVVSGAAAYADAWHAFAQTTARLADILAASGHGLSISEDVETALADLSGVDLAVVNVGCPRPDRPAEALEPVTVGLTTHLASGGGLLGVHVSLTSFTTMPDWSADARWRLGPRYVDASSSGRGPRAPDRRPAPHPDRPWRL